jgi:hypothetical protein
MPPARWSGASDEDKLHVASLAKKAAAFLRNSLICVARNSLQDKAQRFGSALKVSEDATAILLLILVGTWIPVAHAVPECVVE